MENGEHEQLMTSSWVSLDTLLLLIHTKHTFVKHYIEKQMHFAFFFLIYHLYTKVSIIPFISTFFLNFLTAW